MCFPQGDVSLDVSVSDGAFTFSPTDVEDFVTIIVMEDDIAEDDEEFSILVEVDGQPTVTINMIIRENDGM